MQNTRAAGEKIKNGDLGGKNEKQKDKQKNYIKTGKRALKFHFLGVLDLPHLRICTQTLFFIVG